MAVFPVCMSGYHLDAWCLWKSEESVRFPGLQVVVSSFLLGHLKAKWVTSSCIGVSHRSSARAPKFSLVPGLL